MKYYEMIDEFLDRAYQETGIKGVGNEKNAIARYKRHTAEILKRKTDLTWQEIAVRTSAKTHDMAIYNKSRACLDMGQIEATRIYNADLERIFNEVQDKYIKMIINNITEAP